MPAVRPFEPPVGVPAVRKWKGGGGLGSTASWEYEIGEPATTADAAAASSTVGSAAASASGGAALRVSSSNPTLVCRESREAYIWRVRNLPYPKSVYSLSVDDDKQQIVLRTSNKKCVDGGHGPRTPPPPRAHAPPSQVLQTHLRPWHGPEWVRPGPRRALLHTRQQHTRHHLGKAQGSAGGRRRRRRCPQGGCCRPGRRALCAAVNRGGVWCSLRNVRGGRQLGCTTIHSDRRRHATLERDTPHTSCTMLSGAVSRGLRRAGPSLRGGWPTWHQPVRGMFENVRHRGELTQRKDTTGPVMLFTPPEEQPHTASVIFMHGLGVRFAGVSATQHAHTLASLAAHEHRILATAGRRSSRSFCCHRCPTSSSSCPLPPRAPSPSTAATPALRGMTSRTWPVASMAVAASTSPGRLCRNSLRRKSCLACPPAASCWQASRRAAR